MRKLRQGQGTQCREWSANFRSEESIDNEVVGCEFDDVRHSKRLRQLLEQLSRRVGATTPWASQDWANTKAACRFFGNERIRMKVNKDHFDSLLQKMLQQKPEKTTAIKGKPGNPAPIFPAPKPL